MKTRRRFLTVAGASSLMGPAIFAQDTPPSREVRVGVIGLGRGKDHLRALLQVKGVKIAAVCDVDSRRLTEGARQVEAGGQAEKPVTFTDLRKMLEDKSLDAVTVATCNFWHAPATLLALQAGKHVYVEKPGSHTPQEGDWMAAAAKKAGKLVQQGTQRRSLPALREAIDRLKAGEIGEVRAARCWYDNQRGTIGRGATVAPPEWLDWNLWQGPVAEKPFKDNLVHYNWHWLWHYGGGELANNGVHALDLALWGLTAVRGRPLFPHRVVCNGGRYHFDDDQETPDTIFASFDFGDAAISWEGSSCHKRNGGETHPMCSFYGEKGTLALGSAGYQIFDAAGKSVAKNEPSFSDVPHFQNFIDALRDGAALNCPVEEGQRSTLLCHLGNMAYRTGTTVDFDPATRRIKNNAAAEKLWSKEYRPGWGLPWIA